MAPYADVCGSVTLGGGALSKGFLSYVPQFDHLVAEFTVMETLSFSAMLKLDRTKEKVEGDIRALAELLGFASLLPIRISQIAQGQKKLVSIAIGLITKPRALFLDEPTTGLDSTAAHFVVEHVKAVAETGVTVIMTIHQPSSEVFAMLDDIILLDSTGNLAFSGPIGLGIGYFSQAGYATKVEVNPADKFLEAVSSTPAGYDTWSACYDANPAKRMAADVLKESRAASSGRAAVQFAQPSEFSRLILLVRKLSLQYWRTPGAYFYRLITITMFGLFAGSLYFDLKPETASVTEVTGCIFFGLWCSLYLTMGNIPIFLRHRYDAVNNYASGRHSFSTYCIAQFVAAIPWQFMCASTFTTLIYWMPFHNWQISEGPEAFIFAICTSFVMMLTQEAVNWCLIEVLQSDMLASTAAMTVLGNFFVMAGFFVKIVDMPWVVRWIAYMVPTKYVFPGHMFNFFNEQNFTNPTGQKIAGSTLIYNMFGIDYGRIANSGSDAGKPIYGGYRKWMDLLIGMAFVLHFRNIHRVLLKKKNGNLGGSLPTSNVSGMMTWEPPSTAHNNMPETIPMKLITEYTLPVSKNANSGVPNIDQPHCSQPSISAITLV
jgi:ABC-type multidrug transport system ATPase subunit